MPISFFDSVRARVAAVDSLLCVGLDPHIGELPEPTASAALAFCLRLIEETQHVAAAFKPNSAFFEAFGAEGITALHTVIKSIPDGIPVILDAKRGDISTTAAAYAVSAFDKLEAHAITLAPYMGQDSIDPFVKGRPDHGCFVLCKTSNASANDFQTLSVGSRALFEEVAAKCEQWNVEDNVGLVVGATDVDALRRVRFVTPDLWILTPGIGAQGGNLKEVVMAGLSASGLGLLVPVSRGISNSADPKQAAESLRDAINAVRKMKVAAAPGSAIVVNSSANEFIKFALSFGVLKFGDFTLKSGRQSPYFFNAGLFRTGRALGKLGKFYAQAIHDSSVEFDVLFGPAYKGITLAAAVAIAYADMYGVDIPFAYNRKEAKDHGEGGVLVGADMTGKRYVTNKLTQPFDDVITAGTAIREAFAILSKTNAQVAGVCISLDRQEKVSVEDTRSAIDHVKASFSIPVMSIATLDNLVAFLENADPTTDSNASYLPVIRAYRADYGVSTQQD
uniref:Orotidine 5'-phosphate decarboxylase n=1 Tax=Hyaloperonospora arabidopsidis (strain Emoy2) TaxID=559515 RepID=M4BYA3_HYAAE